MIHIEKIQMNLPAGFQHRATSIGLRIGKILAEQGISEDVFIQHISVNQGRIPLNTTDDEIAQNIVNKVVAAYRGHQS